jgi:ketosteroid isomerase-like protein
MPHTMHTPVDDFDDFMEQRAAAAPMDLRVTEIFRRENGVWKLVHRHADPNAHAA